MRKLLLFIMLAGFCSSAFAQEKETYALIETSLGNMKVKLYNDTPIHRDNFVKFAKEGFYDGTIFYRVIKGFMIQAGTPTQRSWEERSKVIDAEIKNEHYHKRGALAAPRQPDAVNAYKESDISQFYLVQGRKYDPAEIDVLEKSINVPIKNAIQRKYLTKEKKELLDTLRAQKRVSEFREEADKIKQNIDFEWANNTEKLYMPQTKRDDYINLGGSIHLDGQYTVFGEIVEGIEVLDKICDVQTNAWDRPEEDVKIKVTILEDGMMPATTTGEVAQ